MLVWQLQKECDLMKIILLERQDVDEPELTVRCRRLDGQVARLMELLRLSDARLTGARDGETVILDPGQVLYIDTADRATFLYTADGVYETPFRLYELEARLGGLEFLRVSKSSIINFDHVKALRPDFGGRMRLTMSNGEAVMVSRQYVPAIKAKLGLGKESL